MYIRLHESAVETLANSEPVRLLFSTSAVTAPLNLLPANIAVTGFAGMAEATQRPAGLPTSWSDIPWDLAGRVLHLLPAYVDRVRFSAVCPQWRGAARQLLLPPPLPLLAVPDGTFYSVPYGKPFCFPGFGCADYKAAATCGSWLVFPRDDGCFLVDPFAGATVELPPLSRIRLRPANAVRRKGHPYTTWMSLNDDTKGTPLTLNKLVLCAPNLVAATFGDGPICQILMCQPGASSWSVRAYDSCRPYEDMAFYQGKLYGLVGSEEILLVVNISQDPTTGDPQVARIGQAINGDPDRSFESWLSDNTMHIKKLYLVESACGALLMVRRKICCRLVDGVCLAGRTIEFQVLEADWEHSRWVKVTTLGDDLMLFLGRSCSKVVRASQYGMSGDQIFFLDDVFENDENNRYIVEGNTCASVYDMTTGEISSPLPMV